MGAGLKEGRGLTIAAPAQAPSSRAVEVGIYNVTRGGLNPVAGRVDGNIWTTFELEPLGGGVKLFGIF